MEVASIDSSDNTGTRLTTRSMSLESARSESSCHGNTPRKKIKAKRRTKGERDKITQRNSNTNESQDEEETGKQYFHIVELRIFYFVSDDSKIF